MNYTRGEWIADIRVGMVAVHVDDKEKFNCLDATQNECIYVRHGYRGKDGWEVSPEYIANAHLIAAAPEMYEALKDIIEQAEKTLIMLGPDLADSIRVFGKQALAKAEGK